MDAVSQMTSSSIQADYMKILVTQLQNQNPLEPLDNQDMASQLAQFSQLQQLESMNSSFSKVLATTELAYADSLIGKEVSFIAEGGDGVTDLQSALVEQVYKGQDDEIFLVAGNYTVSLPHIISVEG